MTFSDAAAILQSSPDEVELIVSQPKCKVYSGQSIVPVLTVKFFH